MARRLKSASFKAEALILETSYAGGLPTLRKHLTETRPKAVLMLGLAARARFVRVELFARGHSSRLHVDANTGKVPAGAARRPARTHHRQCREARLRFCAGRGCEPGSRRAPDAISAMPAMP